MEPETDGASVASSDSNADMFSARATLNGSQDTITHVVNEAATAGDAPSPTNHSNPTPDVSKSKLSLDLLDRINGMYRLLDLRNDNSSGGMVDKVVIDQKSVARFANAVHLDSYRSTTKVDFRALDEHTIKPLAIYGSILAIADFLVELNVIDQETRTLLLVPRSEKSGVAIPTLRPGIYLLDMTRTEPNLYHVIFWPEDTTWEDNSVSSVSRNRVTFMRYMTKLCDQVACLISEEHSSKLVWKDEPKYVIEESEEKESFKAYDRLFTFSVQQTNEEEESAIAKAGFSLHHDSIVSYQDAPPGFPAEESHSILDSQLILGDTSQAILQVEFVAEKPENFSAGEIIFGENLRNKLRADINPNIILGDALDTNALRILLDFGLWSRCGRDLQSQWKMQLAADQLQRQKDEKTLRAERLSQVETRISKLQQSMPLYLVDAAIGSYPILLEFKQELLNSVSGKRGGHVDLADLSSGKTEVLSWFDQNSTLAVGKRKEVESELRVLEAEAGDAYTILKRRLRCIDYIIKSTPGIGVEDIRRLVGLINLDPGFEGEVLKITGRDEAEDFSLIRQYLPRLPNISLFQAIPGTLARFTPGKSAKKLPSQPLLPSLGYMEDIAFAAFLEDLVVKEPVFVDVTMTIKSLMMSRLKTKLRKLKHLPNGTKVSMQREMNLDVDGLVAVRQQQETDLAWASLKSQVQSILASESSGDGPKLVIEDITRHESGAFRLQGTISTVQEMSLRYTLRPLEVRKDDATQSSGDKSFVCQPVIQASPPPFTLSFAIRIRYIRMVGRDSCLVILQNESHFEIYMDQINILGSTVELNKPKKKIHISKVGADCLFAIDETRHLLVIMSCHQGSITIYVYTYDMETKTFNVKGGPINITKWYSERVKSPTFTRVVFVAGSEELLLCETTGISRIYSLVTENFRPSSLDIGESISEAFSSPDGTCLFLVTGIEGTSRIRCVHLASFGSTRGIEIERPQHIPPNSRMVVSSVGHKTITHLLFLDMQKQACHSLLIQITSKSSDFTVHSDVNRFGTGGDSKSSINNSLIDCHSEVWTRFPVYGALKRETSQAAIHRTPSILFVSSAPSSKFPQYFTTLIRDFEAKTRKPTKGLLKKIDITASDEWPPDLLHGTIATSELPLGEWLVGMFCLIPIHLAVTHSNRFVPLKDGMSSPEFERSLLGANVLQIAQALSFGWYESIFSSYLAKRPVKVVTSMGEQSVGKSFALNHFVDTSFAGSAMRCTEGVWLSVTPGPDYVAVSMDFEGVHSIERSAQEDTLLVLLNAAISNFVLFRNNFAMSRDIAGLFTSFQSSTNVLDSSSNGTLFNGTLGIIIKDVIDSDTKDIVNEFYQKFQSIVEQEKGNNFLSKLHKGNFDIIPWPVIESAQFYELFGALKMRLDSQPLTHRHAGAFIGDLKMLMAKLKANDWGALDLNLAVQRADQLSNQLNVALAFGTTDPSTGEPLKHFDTDELILGYAPKAVLYLEDAAKAVGGGLSIYSCLEELRRSFPECSDRFAMEEEEYFARMTTYLQSLVNGRIEHVNEWLKANTERFSGNSEVIKLFRGFEGLVKDLKAGVALCGSKCSSCGLLCLEHKLHETKHDCKTLHKCPQICSFTDQHTPSEFPPCGISAGHSGRHVCSGVPHLCDVPCHLHSKEGCLGKCSKQNGHDDNEEHLCAANVHACGEPCSLVKTDGTRICPRPCVIDCRRKHEQHTCDRSLSCPLKCQLCSSFCAAGNHFHALEEGATHLCGQTHACRELCQEPGICEIATTPQSVESTFVGKHATYQYTKYTQEAKRLHCIVPIEADQLTHEGHHRHNIKAFHYCKERCKQCGYYCTLPLDHPQNQHETSHGSMSQTEWVVEGDENAAMELQGHRYATGDSGAPMLCSMICKSLGRHAHIDRCRPGDDGSCLGGPGIEHMQGRAGLQGKQDWITHRLFWARSGFKDPYANTEQADFELCGYRCGGEEHDPDVNPGAPASYCTLPLFHSPADASNTPALGHASIDGHAYTCKNPAQMQRSFHIFFALDRSSSMRDSDRRPLQNSPATQRIVQTANNRFGAVLSSMYGFWTARDAALRSTTAGVRRDAYTIIPFSSTASVLISNDIASDPDQLLGSLLGEGRASGGTNFTHALQVVQQEMEKTWSTERTPVLVFLSDGECTVADSVVYDLCRKAVTLGNPLTLHSVSFGRSTYSQSLQRMAAIAEEVYRSAPATPLAPSGSSCAFNYALDTIQLVDTFMGIAASLGNPRAALSRIL